MKIKAILAVIAFASTVFGLGAYRLAFADPAGGAKPPATGTRSLESRFTEVGFASFYLPRQRTASGAGVQLRTMTAAHPRLPLGSRVRVRHLKSGKEVVVTITDRGPFHKNRIIDVSSDAAKTLGMTGQGVARVRITLVE